MAEIKPVIFRVGTSHYGIDISKVQAIELYSEIVPVPNAVACVDGLINIRGEVIPVYNLNMRNGGNSDTGEDIKDKQFIIVMCNGSKLALMVDFVEDIKDVKEECFNDMPVICKNSENNYMLGIIQQGSKLAIIVDVDKLLSEDELEVLHEVMK